ncbi:MAG: mechanosensitive ion channel [Rhodospirillales bacterium]
MPEIPDLQPYLQSALNWLLAHVLTVEAGVQLAAVLVTLCIALLLRGQIKAGVARLQTVSRGGFVLRRLAVLPLSIYIVLAWLTLLYLILLITTAAGGSHRLITIAVSLQTAWVIIRLTSGLLRNPLASRTMASIAWALAALNIVGLLDPTLAMLEGVSASFGDFRISALAAVKAAAVGAFLLWAALTASRFVELQISRSVSLTPSIQVLTSKLIKIVLITLAVVVALSGVGIDLTAFAVFSGAVGVGIGFGLQKIISNLISGVILLLDRSIKPGDVIQLEGTYGWVNTLSARYVSVVTRDGVEHLIPNENLITQNVINWSYSSRKVRLRAPLGVSYDTDLPHALKVCMEAAGSLDRVLKNPAPNCLITGFGDSSVDLELRFWVEDPEAGAGNIKSAVYLAVWEAFREHGISIPFPQREIAITRWTKAGQTENKQPEKPPPSED